MMNAKLTLALVAAGLLGVGMTVKAEDAAAAAAATGTATATEATATAPAAAKKVAKKTEADAKFIEKLKNKHPEDYKKYTDLLKTDKAAADKLLADLKEQYNKKAKKK